MVVGYLIIKEFKQMLRNKLLPIVFVILPVALMNLVPRIATQEVKGLKFAVVDNDHSTTARRLINKIDASTYLALTCYTSSRDEALAAIHSGTADVIVEIPAHYSRDLVNQQHPQISISANATNGTLGGMSSMYIQQILASSQTDGPQVKGPSQQVGLKYLFNQQLDYKIYMIPAIFALLLILIVGFLPALNIVSEKEKGTIEQINVSPIGKVQFIISKIVPYVVVGIVMTLEALLAARGIWQATPAGSIGTLLLFAVIFSMVVSSLGLIVSNFTNTIQQAALTMFFFLVIFILMSGLLTPVTSMPQWAQRITLVNPMRYFIEAMRFIFVKGSTLQQLAPQLISLTVYALVGWAVAIISYRKNS